MFELCRLFLRSNLHIFGHNMANANLMDIILPDDVFTVELVDE